jgi:hypothetical protein
VEETGITGENHSPDQAIDKLYHIILYLQTIHRKLKIEQHEHPTKKPGVNSGAMDG